MKSKKDIVRDSLLLEPEQREEYLLLQKVRGVCRYGKDKWRAYLHIGDRQVWSKAGFETKSEAVDARREAERRFAEDLKEAALEVAGKRAQLKMVVQADLLDQLVRSLPGGKYEVATTVYHEKTKRLRRKRIGGPYRDYGAARLRAIAYLRGTPFRLDVFRQYLETHNMIADLVEKNRRLAEEKILPLLQVRDMQGTTKRGERVIIGHRWQPVRRFRKTPVEEGGGAVVTKKELAGVHLRIVPDRVDGADKMDGK